LQRLGESHNADGERLNAIAGRTKGAERSISSNQYYKVKYFIKPINQ
jgi:hypothetical protein